jgi:hypothetical protein
MRKGADPKGIKCAIWVELFYLQKIVGPNLVILKKACDDRISCI